MSENFSSKKKGLLANTSGPHFNCSGKTWVPMASTRTTQLVNEISKDSKIITEYLQAHSPPESSFDEVGLSEPPTSPADEDAFTARLKPICATKEFHNLTAGQKKLYTI